MVSVLVGPATFNVMVMGMSDEGSSVICSLYNQIATDAFDYAIQAQGYFRYAIQTMDYREIVIEISNGAQLLQAIQITRD